MAKPRDSRDLSAAVRSAKRIVDDTIAPPGLGPGVNGRQLDTVALRGVAFGLVLRELLTSYEYEGEGLD